MRAPQNSALLLDRVLLACFVLVAVCLSGRAATAEIIVSLDPVNAAYDVPPYSEIVVTAPNLSDGLTFNVTFTPNATDLSSTATAVSIMEIGGDANGTGLFLLGGEIHFLSKMDGGAADAPTGFNDLDFSSGNNMIAIKSSYGVLTAGTEYSVAVVFDPLAASPTTSLAVKPSGMALLQESYGLSGVGVKTNWSGDNSVTALIDIGGNGGATNSIGGNAFSESAIKANDFGGEKGRALYWNDTGSFVTAVPEPSSIVLLVACATIGFTRRRSIRKHT